MLAGLRNRTRPARFARRLERAAGIQGKARVCLRFRDSIWDQLDISRDVSHVTLAIDRATFHQLSRRLYFIHALPVLVALFAHVRTGAAARVEFGDGSQAPLSDISFSATYASATLVPDPDFFNSQGYRKERDDSSDMPWNDRDGAIVWRGSSTHWDHRPRGPLDLDDPLCSQRIRLCIALRNVENADAKISQCVEPLDPATDLAVLKNAGLMGEHVPAASWRARKFAIDIDGNANAFSNLLTRLLFGCCVIKVASERDFRQWYYDRLIPWTHFIPVKADLSDLPERIAWCRSSSQECEAIARAGRKLAQSMTFDSEMADAVRRINARQDFFR